MRLNLVTPIEDGIGYGLCGTNLAIELARVIDLNITCYLPQATVARPIERSWLLPKIRPTASHCDPTLPTLYVQDVGDRPPGDPVVLYTCADTERLPACRRACYDQMDVVVGMCEWNLQALRDAGFERCAAIAQGVDDTLFAPRPAARRVYQDRYVFFSGGKLEYRKGQDVVLAAWRIFHGRHPDALLVTGWFNAWPRTMSSMALSSHIEMTPLGGHDDLPKLAAINGIAPESVIWLDPMPNWVYPEVYRQCDCGLFPTRAEPATNLPMMEMMACGRPVIASYCAGQVDVLDPGVNCRALTDLGREPAGYARPQEEDLGEWWSPSVEELVAQMEWCYENRDEAAGLGAAGAELMHERFTWRETAGRFVELFEGECAATLRPCSAAA